MELHSKSVAALDGTGKLQAVVADRRCFRDQGCVEGVRVVDKGILRDALQQPRAVLNVNLQRIPSDVWRLNRGWKRPASASKDARSRDLAALLAAFEEPLHSQADPEKRFASLGGLQ